MNTPRLTEQELDEFHRRVRISRTKKEQVGRSTVARRTPKAAKSCTVILHGQMPSGKNQVQLSFKNGKLHKFPNKTFTNWRSRCHISIEEQAPRSNYPTITIPVSLVVDYTPGDARTRDVSGQLDALFHLLVYSKVLKDDGLVHHVTWQRMPMNRTHPQVIFTIIPCAE